MPGKAVDLRLTGQTVAYIQISTEDAEKMAAMPSMVTRSTALEETFHAFFLH